MTGRLRALTGGGVAVVTGASSGIGAELARQLAARGHDLLITAQGGEDIHGTAAALADRYSVRVESREVDLADARQRGAFAAELAERDVAVLCNNAGVGRFGPFADTEPAVQVQIDVVAVTELTAAVVPGMTSRGRGALLMVGSTGGNQPVPGAAVYGASKAFVNSLGESLHTELRRSGITCTVLIPGPVRTRFAERAGVQHAERAVPAVAFITAEQAAAAAITGLDRGRRRVAPGVQGRILDVGGRLAPRIVLLPLLHRLIRRYTA